MNYTYTLRTDELIDEAGNHHLAYGITVLESNSLVIINSIPNIFLEQMKALKAINLCNQLNLSPIHLKDLAEDLVIA